MTIREGETAAALAEQLEKPQVTENPSAAWGSFLLAKLSWVPVCAQMQNSEAGTTAGREGF
ncbi:MAG: hypothetical protein ACLTEX_12240, partial [Eggerthella lenta]